MLGTPTPRGEQQGQGLGEKGRGDEHHTNPAALTLRSTSLSATPISASRQLEPSCKLNLEKIEFLSVPNKKGEEVAMENGGFLIVLINLCSSGVSLGFRGEKNWELEELGGGAGATTQCSAV